MIRVKGRERMVVELVNLRVIFVFGKVDFRMLRGYFFFWKLINVKLLMGIMIWNRFKFMAIVWKVSNYWGYC